MVQIRVYGSIWSDAESVHNLAVKGVFGALPNDDSVRFQLFIGHLRRIDEHVFVVNGMGWSNVDVTYVGKCEKEM